MVCPWGSLLLNWDMMYLRVFFVLMFFCSLSFAEGFTLPSDQMELAVTVTQKTMALEYDAAFRAARSLRQKNEGVGCILENVIRISVYDDRGDTTALREAGDKLENCSADGVWDALRKFEIGYVQSESGHSVKGALQTRSAAKIFEESNELEAKAFYAIYAYYVDLSFSWLPFKSDNRKEYLTTLAKAAGSSSLFWPMYLTPLIWMHYDKEDFKEGLRLAESGLSKAPGHPVMLQIKADMLYRLKRYKEAAAIYEESARNYLRRTGKSIRYWCSVLNLVRIYNDAGDLEKSRSQKALLDSPEFRALKNWMPGSLMDDLEKRDLL